MAGFMELQVWRKDDGWYSRYSAPGYLDCTDEIGPLDSSTAAAIATFEAYGEQGDSDDLTPDEQELIDIIGIEAYCAEYADSI